MRTGCCVGVAVILLVASPLAARQQVPVFRAGVEVVTVDVVVLDRSGRPVAGLQPTDFVVTAGKRVRRLVAADYFSSPPRPTKISSEAEAGVTLVPAPANSATGATGRTFIFAVDVDEIRDREGRRERIEVKVNRPGLDVRARREFTPGPAKSKQAR